MIIIECPRCGKKTKLIEYVGGWTGACCDRVVYNSHQLPFGH